MLMMKKVVMVMATIAAMVMMVGIIHVVMV